MAVLTSILDGIINTSASTFNPTGSLSSTEDNTHKNKRSKLQKVKVKTNWSSTIKIAILGILLKMQSPRLLAKCPSHLTKCKYAWNHNLVVDQIGQNLGKMISGRHFDNLEMFFGYFWYFDLVFPWAPDKKFQCESPTAKYLFLASKLFPGHLYV